MPRNTHDATLPEPKPSDTMEKYLVRAGFTRAQARDWRGTPSWMTPRAVWGCHQALPPHLRLRPLRRLRLRRRPSPRRRRRRPRPSRWRRRRARRESR